jgi:putative tricarboxylic transport membrane protein
MPVLVLGLAFLLFGAVSIWDGMRIGGALRARGTLDLVGPDRYLIGVAVLLLAIGALLVLDGYAATRRVRAVASAGARAAHDAESTGGRTHLWLFLALVAYAALLPVLGYLIATVAFTAAAFRIMGTVRWRTIAFAAVLLTALCYGSFLWIADLPLPRGVLGVG